MNRWERIDERWGLPPMPEAGAPVFVLSAGWRSGSTLLQRLLVSSREVLVWGEPYGRAGLIEAMARSAAALDADDFPKAHQIAPTHPTSDLSQQWIANLHPEPAAFRAGFRAHLDTWLSEPAAARGFSRFGLKEVRLDAESAGFLRWIYPDARFLFLVRSPWDAWLSFCGNRWFLRWPDRVVEAVDDFARNWHRLAASFLGWDDTSGLLVRYEDLVEEGFDLSVLAQHARVRELDPAVLGHRLRGSDRGPFAASDFDRIETICGILAAQFGYGRSARDV